MYNVPEAKVSPSQHIDRLYRACEALNAAGFSVYRETYPAHLITCVLPPNERSSHQSRFCPRLIKRRDLSDNTLSALPAGIFQGLTSLVRL